MSHDAKYGVWGAALTAVVFVASLRAAATGQAEQPRRDSPPKRRPRINGRRGGRPIFFLGGNVNLLQVRDYHKTVVG